MPLFSRVEIRDLAISAVVLAFALGRLAGFLPALLAVAVAFLAHEVLGHKLVAQRYGCWAEYRMWPIGLLVAVVSSFFGFIFAAPGAVYISPVTGQRFAFRIVHLTAREHGIIALAGPAVNIGLGLAFALLARLIPFQLFTAIASFSLFLAIFNMLPLPPLDGSKVWTWSRLAWGSTTAAAVALWLGIRLIA